MPSWGSFSFAFGPLVALAILVGLVFIMRWAFSGGASLVSRPGRPGPPEEYGLLVQAAAPATEAAARGMHRTLTAAGIHATVAFTTGGPRVMVFPDDAEAARRVLGLAPGA